MADKALADFAGTNGKEVITLAPEEAAKFNAASSAAVDKIIADADAQGLQASAFVKALKGN
jgi:TRAP-type transport system periplasmic protein